jgi:thiosulfate dehydrogenase
MNGHPLPIESQDMLAIISYLDWISARYPAHEIAPWLGVKPLKSTHKPDATQGKLLYQEFCMDCHGADGDGGNKQPGHAGKIIPSIFGKNSYNTSAGMNNLQTFASFIYHNMPLGDPGLQASEALDIAAYVHEQPRPTKD